MKYPLINICQHQARKPATSSEREKSVRRERKSICRVEVVDQALSLANPSLDISARLPSGRRHGVPEDEIRRDCS